MKQSSLLRNRRFGPFFAVQALGALNDNIFRNALATLIVYGIGVEAGWDASGLVNLAALLFILPYFLFSAVFGQLADRFEKSRMIRLIKLFEVAICLFAGVALYLGNMFALMSVVFLLGFQSTLFGPIKYSIIPQLLEKHELTGGNGLVTAGTYVAILAGTVAGPIIAGVPLEIDGSDGLPLKLVDVRLTTEWQVGTASPSFGSRELSYLPFPGEMIAERTNMGFVYVSMDEKKEVDLRDFMAERLQDENAPTSIRPRNGMQG
jgi:MFS family permease